MRKINYEKKVWLTITFFVIVILSTTLSKKFSLADISALGLMLIALQALHLTSKQIGEWRRKDAANTCSSIEFEFNNIARKMIAFKSTASFLQYNKGANNPLEADQNKIQKITTNFDIINEHFKSLKKPDITPSINLLRAYSLSNHYFYSHKHPYSEYEKDENFKNSIEEFNYCWEKFEAHAFEMKKEKLPVKDMEILFYLDNLKLICISD